MNTLFSYSSWVVVYMGVFMAFMVTPWFHQIETIPAGDLVLWILGIPLAILGAPASLIILIGMAIFCVRWDRSSVGAKTLWLIFFFATACFGAAFYFFRVYRKYVDRTLGVRSLAHE
jgi:hypothetical protein